jgi:diguanylate cyclase (GGDEF)-like protein
VNNREAMRIPLIRFFGLGLSSILVIFLLISWLTFSKLLTLESTLKDISINTIPEIVLSGELFNEASKLLEFTVLLANADSDAAKRLAEQELNTYIKDIKNLSNKKLNDSFLERQLEVINLELLEFSDLIWERATLSDKLVTKRDNVSKIFSTIFNEAKSASITQNSQVIWAAEVPELMIKVNQAVNASRMQDVRRLFEGVKFQLDMLSKGNGPQSLSSRNQALIRQIQFLLFSPEGLESLVISHLQLTGRVIGRESFMRNLIEDFSRLLEISMSKAKLDIFHQVDASVKSSQKQTETIGGILVIAILFMVAILFFIQQRVLRRLRHINSIVQHKVQGKSSLLEIKGNDEITDLADTFNEFAETIEKQKAKLKIMSMTDDLTQIANRRSLDIRLQHDFELSVRQKSCLAVLLMDIDYFKRYNDNYGHGAGDECLKTVAKTLSESFQRESDFIARFGGEEFIAVLPNTDLGGAEKIAKQIFQQLHKANLPHGHSAVSDRITISMGISVSTPSQILPPEVMLKKADNALYAAKHAGKNTFKS